MSQLPALYMGSLILRSIGIAVIAGICCWKIQNVAVRHAVWVAVLGAMLLMPVVDYFLPATWVPVRIQQIAAEQPVTFSIVSARPASVPQILARAAVPVQPKPLDWWRVAAALYALASFAMFMRLALAYRKIRKLRRTGRTLDSSIWDEIVALYRIRWRIPVLLESDAVQVPMTVGLVRPSVILPVDWKTWDEWKLRAVLLHEVAHIRRGDWGIAVMAAAAKCVYWLNPLSWFLERKLSQLAEQASDDASLSWTQSTTRYAEILLEFAAASQNGGRFIKGGVAMARQNMKARIERVLGKPQSGTGFVRIAGWTLVIILSVPVIYSAAALRVASEPRKTPIPTYVAEFVRNPLPQFPPASQQPRSPSAPTVVPQSQPNSPNPAGDLRDFYQSEVEKQKLEERHKASEQMFEMLRKYNQAFAGPAPESQNAADRLTPVAFPQEELIRAQNQLKALQAEVEMRKSERTRIQVQMGNQPNPNQSQLDQLRVNEAALDRLLAQIDSLSRQMEEKRLASSSVEKADTNSKNRVFVTGKVQRSGDLRYDKPLTVLQALALAGGFQEYAKPDAISIIRMTGDSSTLFQFNYSNVIKGVNTSQNIYLENGDVVVVP